jgi:hypothetical protein
MGKKFFEEHQLYLLKNWADAQLFEESMEDVRENYEKIFDKVLKIVKEKHEELDCPAIRLTNENGLNVGIGKKSWSMDPNWPSGLWLDTVRLEDLASEEEGIQSAVIWIDPPKNIKIDLDEAVKKLLNAAKNICTKEEDEIDNLDSVVKKSKAYITYPLPQSRQQLRDLLIAEDMSGFTDCMVKNFEVMTQFIPIISKIFQDSKRMRD